MMTMMIIRMILTMLDANDDDHAAAAAAADADDDVQLNSMCRLTCFPPVEQMCDDDDE
jgi:hypothetical protein